MAFGQYSNYVYSDREAINAVWILCATANIYMMQCGFALLECGSVRKKNASSILIKNLFDACVGYCGFWLVGYAFAFGDVK
jgi:Amt family ammonium transporter